MYLEHLRNTFAFSGKYNLTQLCGVAPKNSESLLCGVVQYTTLWGSSVTYSILLCGVVHETTLWGSSGE